MEPSDREAHPGMQRACGCSGPRASACTVPRICSVRMTVLTRCVRLCVAGNQEERKTTLVKRVAYQREDFHSLFPWAKWLTGGRS